MAHFGTITTPSVISGRASSFATVPSFSSRILSASLSKFSRHRRNQPKNLPCCPARAQCHNPITDTTNNSKPNQNHLPSSSLNPLVKSFDFLVLGSGIAGLTYALKVAEHGRVAVITKGEVSEGCTQYAQGGICAVLDPNDSVEAHIRDTIIAGAFLNDLAAVDIVCREGPGYVLELAEFGARFTRTNGGDLHLTREGGHSARRIVHAADATGAEIERALVTAARAHPNIALYEGHQAVDLVLGTSKDGAAMAVGADALDPTRMTMTRFLAPVTMLATGGAGQVYPLTTNPGVATGDGMAMAHRAKAAVANMEFVQFHPTALYVPEETHADSTTSSSIMNGLVINRVNRERAFLISEAVRGEGGKLYSHDGSRRFMRQHDPRLELAPRDVVARAIHAEMADTEAPHVLLDISHRPRDSVLRHFPNIAAHCSVVAGIDITSEPIPVLPAQHYMCGGVQTGLNGETTIPGLFACGEVACSGLHGANRLASNSLLEGLVFGNRAVSASLQHAERVLDTEASVLRDAAASADFTGTKAPRPLSRAASAWVAAKRSEVAKIMWSSAGIVRRQTTMRKGLQRVAEIYVETRALCESYGMNQELVELRNLVTVSELILSSALQRRESRGGHYCEDFPEAVPHHQARATVINTSLRRRMDLKKITVGAPVVGSGNTLPGSPKRGVGSGRGARELSLMRSIDEPY